MVYPTCVPCNVRRKQRRVPSVARVIFIAACVSFILCLPLGDPQNLCSSQFEDQDTDRQEDATSLCITYKSLNKIIAILFELSKSCVQFTKDILYNAKIKVLDVTNAADVKEDVDKAIEDEITHKLSEDLVQSVQKKFQVDLERSVDMVLVKIKLLLQNGTHHIQDRLLQLQTALDNIKNQAPTEVENCLSQKYNETSALAEKALHQMVVCGYALIGHDPSMAINKVLALKNMIRQEMEPMNAQKKGIYEALRACGHEHDSLKKVVKCVISKSPVLKSIMMEITGKLIDGVLGLTKLLAHGAMHEACLIEVVKTTEDEAEKIVNKVKRCAFNETITSDVDNYLQDNNATILDVSLDSKENKYNKNDNVNDIKELIRRMLEAKGNNFDEGLKEKLVNLEKDLKTEKSDALSKNLNNIV